MPRRRGTRSSETPTETFLGPVTRLKILGTGVDVIADVPTQTALGLPVGTRVAAALPAEGVRILELKEDLPEIPRSRSRHVGEDAGGSGVGEVAHPLLVVHGVDERDRGRVPAPRGSRGV